MTRQIDPTQVDRVATKVAAHDHDATVELMTLFANHHDDDRVMGWIEDRYPRIYKFLGEVPDSVYRDGLADPAILEGAAKEFVKRIQTELTPNRWAELGLATAYEDLAMRYQPEPTGFQFIRDLMGGDRRVGARFVMSFEGAREVLPNAGFLTGRFFSSGMKNAAAERLRELNVKAPDVQLITDASRGKQLSCVHMAPADGALLLDAKDLSDRGAKMTPSEGWKLIRRWLLDPTRGEESTFAMPVHSFTNMRGIAYGLPENPTAEQVLAKCVERLNQRGIENAIAVLKQIDGEQTICLPADHARVLIAPIAENDPATKLKLTRMDYNPEVRDYDPENAVVMLQAADLAYKEKAEVDRYCKGWGFEQSEFISKGDAQAFVAFDKEKNTIIVSFRGSESTNDFLADADPRVSNGGVYGGGEVHRGFHNQLQAVLPDIMKAIEGYSAANPSSPPQVMLTGHSLGGAMAALFAGYFTKQGGKIASIYTCGQPKVGDKDFNQALTKMLKESGTGFFRFVNNNDLITRIPATWDHPDAGVELYFDRYGVIHPPGTGASRQDRQSFVGALFGGEVEDHRSGFYIGLARKNRDVFFKTFLS